MEARPAGRVGPPAGTTHACHQDCCRHGDSSQTVNEALQRFDACCCCRVRAAGEAVDMPVQQENGNDGQPEILCDGAMHVGLLPHGQSSRQRSGYACAAGGAYRLLGRRHHYRRDDGRYLRLLGLHHWSDRWRRDHDRGDLGLQGAEGKHGSTCQCVSHLARRCGGALCCYCWYMCSDSDWHNVCDLSTPQHSLAAVSKAKLGSSLL